MSYQRFDPLSMLAGVAADFVDAGHSAKPREADKLATHLTLGIAKNLTNKTWLSGAADFFQMMDDPDRYGDRYFRNLAATATVPSILNQTAQAIDPNLRDARTLMDAIKARTPGLSQSIAPRRDMWGEAITRGDSVGPDFLSPLYATTETSDPLKAEVARLRVPVSMPQRDVMVDGERVPLTPEQYDQYQRLAGAGASQALRPLVGSKQWATMTDPEKADAIQETFKAARKAARGRLVSDFPELSPAKKTLDLVAKMKIAPRKAGLPPLPPGFVLTG